MAKNKLDNLTKIILVLIVIVGLFLIYFLIGIKYSALVPLEVNSFSSEVGACTDCSFDGSLEIANSHSDSSNAGLLAYWQFSDGKNVSDVVQGLPLKGSFFKSHEKAVFLGGSVLSAECQASCGGEPSLDSCSQWDSSQQACQAFNSHTGCQWSNICKGNVACENQIVEEACASVPGCSWGGSNCYGSPSSDCGYWNDNKTGCMSYDDHGGDCTWQSPCSGMVSCQPLKTEKECAIVAGCIWVGSSSIQGYCDGGVSSCSQWDMDKESCVLFNNHNDQCKWVGPCQGTVNCLGQASANACQAVQGCTLDTKFPVSGKGKWSTFAWVRTSESGTDQTLFGMGDSNVNNGGVYLRIGQDGNAYADLIGNSPLIADEIVNDDLWHLIGMVYDGKNVEIYIDGVLKNSIEASPDLQCSGFNIGSGAGASNFKGELDEVKVYGVALSGADVSNLFQVGLFLPSAEFVSRVYDLSMLSSIESVYWESKGVHAHVVVQFKTSADNQTWSDWSREYKTPGDLNLDFAQYIQYKIRLSTDDLTETPSVSLFNISYAPADTSIQFVEPSDYGIVSKDSIDAVFSSAKAVANMQVTLKDDNGTLVKSVTLTNKPYSVSFTGLSNGHYYMEATAAIGNTQLNSETRELVVDTGYAVPVEQEIIRVPVSKTKETSSGTDNAAQNANSLGIIPLNENPVRGTIDNLVKSLT